MNLDWTDTQELLRDTVRGYLEKEVPFDRIRKLEGAGDWDAGLWQALVEQGWAGLPLREELGGGDGSWVDTGILLEELARRAALVPALEVMTAGRILQDFGGDAGLESVRAIAAGDALPVPALLESGDRFDEVTAEVSDGRLTGEKCHVDYGQIATHHLVAARSGDGPALFLVATDGDAVECEPLRSIGRSPVCVVRYEAAPATRVGGADAWAALLRLGRALATVQCVGSMSKALDATVEYAQVREQFGRAIGTFQAVQHHCANMAVRVASARLLAFEALSSLDAGSADDVQVALAKASASRAAPEVLMLAHQIHGGNGVIEENDLYFFTLRGKERSLAWGSVEECLALVADAIEPAPEWL